MSPRLRGLPFPLFGLIVVFLLGGCSHYRLGSGEQLPFRSVYVAVPENEAFVPQAAALVGNRLRERLIEHPEVVLASSPETADAILTVHITGYRRETAAARADDTGLARKLDIHIAARCSLKSARGDRIYFQDREITAVRDVLTDGGQLPAEYQTMPALADALALAVARAVTDAW